MIIPASQERVSELIGRIYDCVLEPQSWASALEEIRMEFGFANAVLAVNAVTGAADFYAHTRISLEDLKLSSERHGTETIAMWGGERIQHYALGEPIVLSRLQPREVLRATRWYQEWARPRGLADALTIRVTNDPLTYGNVTLGQADDDVRDDQIDNMRLLAPHLRRAVTISNVLNVQAAEVASLAAIIDALQVAVVLVDAHCGMVYANPPARAMFARDEPVQLRNGFVTVAAVLVRDALLSAVKQAAHDETRLSERGLGIPVKRASGDPAVIHILPMRRGTRRGALAQKAVAALFVVPALTPAQMPRDALVLLYDMTPAEVRVCEMIIRGVPPGEIAVTLGVSINTIRSHLAHVFEKTNTKGQVDLVKLIASLTFNI